MAIDFPLPPLRRFLWDHLSELVPSADVQHEQHPHHHLSSGAADRSRGSGVSSAWVAGMGHEGYDGFHITLKKFSSGQSNPTFLLMVHLSPPSAAANFSSEVSAGTTAAAPLTCAAAAANSVTDQRGEKHTFRFVLRKKPASVKVSSAHAVEREFRILRALRLDTSANVPVPRALLLCEDPAVIGTSFYVMEFVEGRIFSDAALPGLERAERAAAYESAAETLARIHRVDFVAAGLEGFGRSKGGYLERQVATLERVAAKQAEDAGPINGFNEVVQDLRDLTASGNVVPDRVTIVHGDFRIDNLVYHPVEPRVIAVLDWELSTLGHPLADLANLCILHHLPSSSSSSSSSSSAGSATARGCPGAMAGPGAAAYAASTRAEEMKSPTSSPTSSESGASPLAGLKGLDLEQLGIPPQSTLMEAYRRAAAAVAATPGGGDGDQLLAGVAGPGVAELGLAFVFFKMAVIAHGVKARQSRGVASSAQASLVSAMVPAMVALALEQISALKNILAGRAGGDKGGHDGSAGGGGRGGGKASPKRSLRAPKAVLFDVGGVLSESPLLAIAKFEREARPRLPPSYVGVAIATAGEGGLFQRLERGEERLGNSFLERFREYLCSDRAKRAYVDWCVARLTEGKLREGQLSSSSSILSTASQGGGRASVPPAVPRAATDVVNWNGSGETDAARREKIKAAVASVTTVDVRELFRRISESAQVPVPEMFAAAKALRRQGFKVGVVSNDFLVERGFDLGRRRRRRREDAWGRENTTEGAILPASASGSLLVSKKSSGNETSDTPDKAATAETGANVYSRLPALCDAVVLSSRSGCRKPGSAIYEDACQALGISPPEAVFVDDLRANIQAAEALGMRTVWVPPGGSLADAISGLETATGIKLPAATPRGKERETRDEGVRRPAGKL